MRDNGLNSGFRHLSIPEKPNWAVLLNLKPDKFAVIDHKTVITGSFNWSLVAAHTNDETLLVIHSPQLAKHFTREMNRMWRGAELGITKRMRRKLERQKIRCGDGVERG